MKTLALLIAASLMTFWGCEAKHSTVDVSQVKPLESSKPTEPVKASEKLECLDSEMFTCQDTLNLYVQAYNLLPKEPTAGLLLWALRLEPLNKAAKSIDINDDTISEDESMFTRANTLLTAAAKKCPTDITNCFKSPEEHTQFVDLLETQRKNILKLHYFSFIKRYANWASKINFGSEQLTIDENNPEPLWMPWAGIERYVINQDTFSAYAKEQALCDSDKMYSAVIEEGDEPTEMNALLKQRICDDQTIVLDELEMTKLNFTVTVNVEDTDS